jgi:hypothetical protein
MFNYCVQCQSTQATGQRPLIPYTCNHSRHRLAVTAIQKQRHVVTRNSLKKKNITGPVTKLSLPTVMSYSCALTD